MPGKSSVNATRRNRWKSFTPAVIAMVLCMVDAAAAVSRVDSTMGYSLLVLPYLLMMFLLLAAFDLAAKFTVLCIKRLWYIQLAVIVTAFSILYYYWGTFPGQLLGLLLFKDQGRLSS